MNRLIQWLLMIGLGLLALGLVLFQVLIPDEARWLEADYLASGETSVAGLALPLSVLAILGLGCIQAVLVMIIRLVRFVSANQIFDPQALSWVSAIIAAMGIATALTLAAFVLLTRTPMGPVGIYLLGLMIFGLSGMALMWVLRGLLVKAINYNQELAQVI
jgi:hypothetical protein